MSKSKKRSAGLLMYRRIGTTAEVFLVHPGGPYWSKKSEGYWTIPKGEYETGESPKTAALREFEEETGVKPTGPHMELGLIQQKSGKVVTAWAFEGDCDPSRLVSNTCEIEWPPRSRKYIEIPEVDRGDWFSFDRARLFLRAEQAPFLDTLEAHLALVLS